MTLATGVGSMPGDDADGVPPRDPHDPRRLPDLPHLAELPGRGPTSSMTGRGAGRGQRLAADLQPAGWRLTDASGIDHRPGPQPARPGPRRHGGADRGYTGAFKIQVAGPWTLAATVEKPRGDKVLSDHGARRELAQALAEGLRDHVADAPSAAGRGPAGRLGRRAGARGRPGRQGPDGVGLGPAPHGAPARGLRHPGLGAVRDRRSGRRAVGAQLRRGTPLALLRGAGATRALGRPRGHGRRGPGRARRGARGGETVVLGVVPSLEPGRSRPRSTSPSRCSGGWTWSVSIRPRSGETWRSPRRAGSPGHRMGGPGARWPCCGRALPT